MHPPRPVIERFPGLATLAWQDLGDLPTPVTDASSLAAAARCRRLWVKRDDLSGAAYGGNKIRKLELLLAEARAAGASDIITFGAAGSNHALATAIYGRQQGMRVHSMLMPQPNAPYVRRNLLASSAVDADVRYFDDADAALRGAATLRRELEGSGRSVFVIPFGGTTPSSTVGFVNAAFELADQVRAGLLEEPDDLFVTLGSGGTAAGLALGCRAVGLRTRVIAVPVIADGPENADLMVRTIRETQRLLAAADPGFPVFDWSGNDFDLAQGFVGPGYAVPTFEGAEAIRRAAEAGILIDGTYAGKTFAALLSAGAAGRLEGRDVLFWDTYSSRDLSALVEAGDPSRLPEGAEAYLSDEAVS